MTPHRVQSRRACSTASLRAAYHRAAACDTHLAAARVVEQGRAARLTLPLDAGTGRGAWELRVTAEDGGEHRSTGTWRGGTARRAATGGSHHAGRTRTARPARRGPEGGLSEGGLSSEQRVEVRFLLCLRPNRWQLIFFFKRSCSRSNSCLIVPK